MNALKKIGFTSVALLAGAQTSFAAITTGNVDERLKGRTDTLDDGIEDMIAFLTNFLYLIAVAYSLYGGFLMLTSGGEEEKVKKGKTILMHAALGLLVIFIASQIVSFVLSILNS